MQTSNKIVRTSKPQRSIKSTEYRSERDKKHNRSNGFAKRNWTEAA